MAKEKRSAADLDAELAALEAELAALENKPRKKAKPETAPRSAAATPPAPEPEPAPAPEPKKKGRFTLPKLGKKEAPGPAPAAPVPSSAPSPPPPAPRPSPEPSHDLSLWRQEGDAWVRVVPETRVPVVRRILDEQGNLVREEAATERDVEEASGVKAERGLGRLLRRK